IEAIRQKAFEYQRVYTRTGGFDFDISEDGEHHLQLFHWFRDPEDIQILQANEGKITQFQFKSLNLVFDVNPKDGRAYVNESRRAVGKPLKFGDYFIASDQGLPKGMQSFAKFLVLENAEGHKRVILAQDSLDATVGTNLTRAITRQSALPLLTRIFQSWADQVFPSNRSETAYFVYDYNLEDGRLESEGPCAMSYLLFYYLTQGEVVQADQILKKLNVLALQQNGLSTTLEPLLRRIHLFAMLQPDRRTLFLGLKLAALREQFPLVGKEDKRERLAPHKDEVAWEWLDVIGMQASMQRYIGMKYRMVEKPLSNEEEYLVLKGIRRRLETLQNTYIDPAAKAEVKERIEEMSLGELVATSAPTWVSALASKTWGFMPTWVNEKSAEHEGKIKHTLKERACDFYDQHKSSISYPFMAPELQKRLAELENRVYDPQDTIKARVALLLPRQLAKKIASPFEEDPFKTNCGLPFLDSLDAVFGFDVLANLRRLAVHPIGCVPQPVSSNLPIKSQNFDPKNLSAHFFDYYRLMRGEGGSDGQQRLFKKTIQRSQSHDPLVLMLKHAGSKEFPSAQALSRALLLDTLGIGQLPEQSTEILPQNLTEENLKKHFFEYYALAHGDGEGAAFDKQADMFKNELSKILRIDPITRFLQNVVKSPRADYPSSSVLHETYYNQNASLDVLLSSMRVAIMKNQAGAIYPTKASEITSCMIQAHFLDYYRLAMDKSQNDFHAELGKIVGRFDLTTTFLLSALQIVSQHACDAPSVSSMEDAFLSACNGDDAPLREVLQQLKAACQKPYQENLLHKLTQTLPPLTRGTIANLRVVEGEMTPFTIKENFLAAYNLAKGIGDPATIKAFQMQIVLLVDASSDPAVNFLVTCMSLVAQNPTKYPHPDNPNLTQILRESAKQELTTAGNIDIARNLSANVLSETAQKISSNASGWFGFAKPAGIISGALGLIRPAWEGNYDELGLQATALLGSVASWKTQTPLPLNSILFTAENLTSEASEKVENLTSRENTQILGFNDAASTKEKLSAAAQIFCDRMSALFLPHAVKKDDQRYGLKSDVDYFQLRQGLENCKLDLQEKRKQMMHQIVTLANSCPVDFSGDFSDRAMLLTPAALMQIFVLGDQEELQRRTGQSDVQELIRMLLTYHQQCNQIQFLNQWVNKLENINVAGFDFTESDYTLTYPFNWDEVSVDQVRQYFLLANVETNALNTAKAKAIGKKQLQAMFTLYPSFYSKERDDPLSRRLMRRQDTAVGA
ncbi:MAG: hypothetical protein KDK44_05615, partial [Chlamydiia bacterium]|nr:hypothetical protein [Chlamydiia bacterium]